jgi:hypothetical protein
MRRSDAHESLHVRLIPSDGRMSQCCVAAPAAGDRNVLVHGAYTAQRAHEAGVLDELQIDQIPVLVRWWPVATPTFALEGRPVLGIERLVASRGRRLSPSSTGR